MVNTISFQDKKRYYNLDFCRFIFVMLIVNFHNFLHADTLYKRFPDIEFYQKMHQMSSKAYIFVDFFFIISGYFLAHTFFNRPEVSFSKFVKGRIVRLWPMLAFSLFCYWFTSLFDWGGFNYYNDTLHLLFLQSTGIEIAWDNNGPAWFISSLFWNSLLIFYLLKNYQLKNVNLFLAVGILVAFAALIQYGNGCIGAIGPRTMVSVFFASTMLRGFVGIGLGYFLYKFIQPYLEKRNLKLFEKVLFTMFEIFVFFFLVYYTSMQKFVFPNDAFLIFMICCLIALFLIQRGYFSQLLNHAKMAYLGEISFAIYMLQEIAFRFTDHIILPYKNFVNEHFIVVWIISTLVAVVFGVIGNGTVTRIVGCEKN